MENNKTSKRPLSMALAYYELIRKDTNETNDCNRKFMDYLTKFKRTTNVDYALNLQKFIETMKSKYPEHEREIEKDLVQIWNLDLRVIHEIESILPKLVKRLSAQEINQIISELEAYNK